MSLVAAAGFHWRFESLWCIISPRPSMPFVAMTWTTARKHLEQVQKYAPHHVGARNGMAKIRQHQADIEYARMAWELAFQGRDW